MRSWLDSLYGRLALVLLLALVVGFASMHLLFRLHANDNRVRDHAHAQALRIQLVENLLRSQPEEEAHLARDLRIRTRAELAEVAAADQRDSARPPRVPRRLQTLLEEELGRPVEALPSLRDEGGLWVRLDHLPQGERWLFLAGPRHRPGADAWAVGLWAGFVAILVGGMVLLWGVQQPLRRLQHAIAQVGRSDAPRVTVGGPREVRQLAEQFNSMVTRLRQYDEDRAVMLAGLAHDLRAPLTRLRLQMELEDGPRRAAMEANLEGMEAIVRQFLSFSQGEAQEPLRQGPLEDFLQSVWAPYRQQGVALAFEGEPGCIMSLYPGMLSRALANLLENALEYGAPPIRLLARCPKTDSGGEVCLEVSDAGPGIPAERRDAAMQAFTRLDAARGGKGHCGLGLAIAARVAGQHGGRLELAEASPRGLVARLILPRDGPREMPSGISRHG